MKIMTKPNNNNNSKSSPLTMVMPQEPILMIAPPTNWIQLTNQFKIVMHLDRKMLKILRKKTSMVMMRKMKTMMTRNRLLMVKPMAKLSS